MPALIAPKAGLIRRPPAVAAQTAPVAAALSAIPAAGWAHFAALAWPLCNICASRRTCLDFSPLRTCCTTPRCGKSTSMSDVV